MIVTEIYKGQGLGNQLWCYVVTRVIALDKGYSFGIKHPEYFKCLDFLNLDFGERVINGEGHEGGPPTKLPDTIKHYYKEKVTLHPKTGADIRTYDAQLINIADHTKIDGIMQDENYIAHRKQEIKKWLAIKPEKECLKYSKTNICIINFRGGEYIGIRDVFLPQKYWGDAIAHMKKIKPDMQFVVVTDDPKTARKFFPDLEISHDSIASDYSIIQNAYYLILSNSSFAWFPTWLNEKVQFVIAPKYWSQYDTSDGYWGTGYNITSTWHYLDRSGKMYTYEECLHDIEKYRTGNYIDTLPPSREKRIYWLFFVNLQRKIEKLKKLIFKKINKIKYAFIVKITSFLYTFISILKSTLPQKKSNGDSKSYRNNIKIYDVFTYNGEADILEIRLNILYNFVDRFIIVEAPTTFSGLQKPLYFKEQKERFSKFSDKITYFVINDYPQDKEICALADKSKNVPYGSAEHWRREFYQKESVKKALENLDDNDVCYIGDVDEIWNPEVSIDYSKDTVYKMKQIVYVYFLNNKSNEPWLGTIVTKYKNIKNACLNHLRARDYTAFTYVKNGGWHFTSIGGFDEVLRKLRDSYTEETYNTKTVQENLSKRFGKKDYLGRNFTFSIDEEKLPQCITQNKEKYKKLFKGGS